MHEPQSSGETSSKRNERGTQNVAQTSRIPLLHQRCMDQQNRPHKYRTWITMREIEEMLGVKEDSVRRCFKVMREELNMPIDYVAEKEGYGYTQKVTSFPLMTMNESEIGAMIVAQQMLALCEGTSDYETVRKVLKKALLNLGPEFGRIAKAIEGVVSFHAIGFNAPAKVDAMLRAQLTRAAADQEEIEIEHKSAAVGAKWKKVRIQPLHVANVNQAWYLWHDLVDSGERRKYALTRIRNVRRTGKAFERRPFDIHGELKGMGLFTVGKRRRCNWSLARWWRRSSWSGSGIGAKRSRRMPMGRSC